jgi:hypothetical protein
MCVCKTICKIRIWKKTFFVQLKIFKTFFINKSNNHNILFFFERDDPYIQLVSENQSRDDGKIVTCLN